jgi:serine protease AprX
VVLNVADTVDAATVARSVRAAGGRVIATYAGVKQVIAEMPGGVARARTLAGVASALPSTTVRLYPQSLGADSGGLPGSMSNVVDTIGARDLWRQGITGKGIDVAVIDTGIAPLPGIRGTDKLVLGPDLSVESQEENLRYTDTMGHGTHMASIIAGHEGDLTTGPEYAEDTENYYGVAPDARIVSLKVGDVNGAVDVSQVIAAIDWVIQFGRGGGNGINVKVLNLSYGTPGIQDPKVDPLSFAVESAIRAGITVVVSGGNDGANRDGLNNPAYQPDVIAVGATDMNGTSDISDDKVAKFSAGGGGEGPRRRAPDVVAPGTSIVGLRVPGSSVANGNPKAFVGEMGIRGSGTSQAAAVVSGAAALLLSQRPWMSPGWVKSLLLKSARPLSGITPMRQGNGVIDVLAASQTWGQDAPLLYGNGTGSIESARGGNYMQIGEARVYGELDLLGGHWEGGRVGPATARFQMWDSYGNFNRAPWTGEGWLTPQPGGSNGQWWETRSWANSAWVTRSWAGTAWVTRSWADMSWSSAVWTDDGWEGGNWKNTTLTSPMSSDTWSTSRWR